MIIRVILAAALCAAGASTARAEPGGRETVPAVKAVRSDRVCMVTDKVMPKKQLPVRVAAKTYYGCCAGCVATLTENRAARFAKDPLTGRPVDKAKAVILEGAEGAALYFESKDSAARFASRAMDAAAGRGPFSL